jgi:hypothetical protein
MCQHLFPVDLLDVYFLSFCIMYYHLSCFFNKLSVVRAFNLASSTLPIFWVVVAHERSLIEGASRLFSILVYHSMSVRPPVQQAACAGGWRKSMLMA